MDCQLVCELLVFVENGNNGVTVLIGLVLLDIERDGSRIQASGLTGLGLRHPVTGVGNLHLVGDVVLQLGGDGIAIHRRLGVGLVEEQSSIAGLLDGEVARRLGDGVGERDGVCTGIVGIVGLHRDNQLTVVDIKGGCTP